MINAKKISLSGKKIDVRFIGIDEETKVDSIKLNENDLKSESKLIEVLQNRMKSLADGMYSINMNNLLFARFKIVDNFIMKLERWSENTGILMPCWTYFEN